jgi:hypothetical protein
MIGPILKRIGIGVLAATVVVLAVGLMLPRDWSVSRSVTIDAPQPRVHALCEDLEQWPAWTPWFKTDPELEITLGAITRGTGASQSWRGKGSAGELVFTRCEPDWGVAFDLVFTDRGTRAASTLCYAAADSGTVVTWDMQGDSGWNVLNRLLGVMMDPVMGPMLEDGLERLKLVAEDKAPDAKETALRGAAGR